MEIKYKQVINGKLFDTDQAEKISTFKKGTPLEREGGKLYIMGDIFKRSLYVTNNGNYVVIDITNVNDMYAKLIEVEEAKEITLINESEGVYKHYFGDVEYL